MFIAPEAVPVEQELESRYEALIRVSQAINVHRDPAELFQALKNELRNVVKFDSIGIVQYDEAGNEIAWHLAEACRQSTDSPLPQEETIPWCVFQQQQAIVIPSFERETRFPRALDQIKSCGVRSGCAFPLTTLHRRLGVLFLGSKEVDAYPEKDVSFLSLVADQIALAVDDTLNFEDSRRAQQRLQRERDHLKLLLELTNRLVSNLELRDLLRAIAATVRRVMQCDFVGVFLPDLEADALRSFVVDFPESKGFIREEPQDAARKHAIPMDGTLPGIVFRMGKVWSGTADDCVSLGLKNDPGLAEGLKASSLLPIVCGDRTLGVLAVGRRNEHIFGEDDAELLSQVASQVAIAVDNALVVESRERAEKELRRSEAYLAEGQRLSRTGSFGWRVSDGELFWSDETFRIFEYDRAQVNPTVELALERIHPEDLAWVRQTIDRVSQDGKDFELEYRLVMPDDSVKYVHIVAHAVGGEAGKVEYIGSVMDVTEHKLAEAALRNGERELQQLVDVVPNNIFVLGPDGRPLYANEVLLKYFGCTLEDIRASNFRTRIYHPDDFDRVQSVREDAIARGVPWEAEARLRRKDGEYRWFLVRANPLCDEQGRIMRWYSTGTDIEDRKQAEDALRRAQDDLQQERDRLWLLLELTNQVVSNLELGDLLHAVATSVRRVMRCDASAVALPDSETNQLRVHAVDFPEGPAFAKEGVLIPVEGTISGKVFKTGKPFVARRSDLRDDSNPAKALAEIFKAGCFAPLFSAGRTLGVLFAGRTDEEPFSQDDVNFLTQVAGQVGIGVHNAMAYGHIGDLRDKLAQEKLYLEDEIRSEMNFEEIIGNSAALRRILKQVETVAPTESTVLIYGETGTGKELVARALHNLSPRRSGSFVKLNCAAIPTGLLESELFGHERGAFTGAIAQRIGRFELANRGTVFLDEIGEIPLELQPKLLRVLQEREFERLGSARTLRTDARLIAATNRDLGAMVEQQKFRSDLFYRLNVFPIRVPPLRERCEDIPLLVRHFAVQFARRMNKRIDSISSETMSALCDYHWPGNIRELQNVIERAAILSSGPVLEVAIADLETNGAPGAGPQSTVPNQGKIQRVLEETERKQVLAALEESGWVVAGPKGAAARLGMKRSTLQVRMQKLGIARSSKPLQKSKATQFNSL